MSSSSSHSVTVVCVKQVKQDVADEWDESMPLPGDIIEGVAEHDVDDAFISAKARSELSLHLGKINRVAEHAWLKVRRGPGTVKLRVCVVPDRHGKLQKRFTVRAETDERHVAVLADLTFKECFDLQEMSRRVINLDFRGFRQKGIKYDWKNKVGTYLPDHRATVVSSILFLPRAREASTDRITGRAMAWFSAAMSSGIPLIFINIQTEQVMITSERNHATAGKETIRGGQQSNSNTVVNIEKGIRLWFLPGIAEILLELFPETGESRFGLDMRRTEEGFICVNSVTQGTAAARAGLGDLFEEAKRSEHLLIVSRLQGKSLTPSTVDSEGLIHCCDNNEIKEALFSAMERRDSIQLHVMSWPKKTTAASSAPTSQSGPAATLHPPN
ncbi:uncharacterized protein LOC127243557 [Andrographis paniculata]|uniref:uncharacterized protein LOC127243557 n=1 Tax=Andrographis paniculata TaxID=175694 RepID=UPI0021E977B2|nr:uncharacterized protein LOC127243557 [Andrographis paniculata]